jgi:transcriptional regulator with XRE-family HTH domain
MDIKEYRQKFDLTYSDLAERCECGISTLANIVNGRARPSFDLARRIEQATGGLVSHENWYPRSPITITVETSLQ